MMRKIDFQGFTLIELLVTIVLISLISGLAASILVISLRSDNKSSTTTRVQQTGDAIIAQFNDTLRSAQQFNGGSDVYADYNCNPANGNTNVANGCNTDCTGSPKFQSISFTDTSGTPQTFTCSGQTIDLMTFSPAFNTTPTPQLLFDQSSVTVDSCSLTCTQSQGSPRLFLLQFMLEKKSGNLAEQIAKESFKTSIYMRNQ